MELSYVMQNYLEAIYELSGGGGARMSAVAERLGVTKASTNRAISELARRGLVRNEKYGEIFLTDEGLREARATSTKHRVLRSFLTEALGVGFETADRDACAIEHVVSDETIEAMQRHLARRADD